MMEAQNVLNYKFNKSRCKILTNCKETKRNCSGVLYWMLRDCRVQDNWAMLFAQRLAKKNNIPLHVCFFEQPCAELYPTLRHYKFLITGLREIKEELESLNISFSFINDTPERIIGVVKDNNIGVVVTDFHPLKKPTEWQEIIQRDLPEDVCLVQVDAHNIVPAWIASDKQEIAARTIRPKINKKLDEYLVEFPMVSKQEVSGKLKLDDLDTDMETACEKFTGITCREGSDITWARPGTLEGTEMLRTFITERLKYYNKANDPSTNYSSNLSPWIHFGHISAQRCALEAKTLGRQYKDCVEKFLEELIVRRELSDNFCFYNSNYDNFNGADKWAKETLNVHRKDKREYVYTQEQFESASTHDEIWNAAQIQLIQEGKIHNYMRMYWCKKILEWTQSPEDAIKIALFLNDSYSLDGNDPNGFVGVMWSICGIHDHGWKERDIFGKIRYMVDYSLRKKFDIDSYCSKYKRSLKRPSELPQMQDGKQKKIK